MFWFLFSAFFFFFLLMRKTVPPQPLPAILACNGLFTTSLAGQSVLSAFPEPFKVRSSVQKTPRLHFCFPMNIAQDLLPTSCFHDYARGWTSSGHKWVSESAEGGGG